MAEVVVITDYRIYMLLHMYAVPGRTKTLQSQGEQGWPNPVWGPEQSLFNLVVIHPGRLIGGGGGVAVFLEDQTRPLDLPAPDLSVDIISAMTPRRASPHNGSFGQTYPPTHTHIHLYHAAVSYPAALYVNTRWVDMPLIWDSGYLLPPVHTQKFLGSSSPFFGSGPLSMTLTQSRVLDLSFISAFLKFITII